MPDRRVEVFGPAYLDRVLRVDQPLIDDSNASPFDQSVDGAWEFSPDQTLNLVDPSGYTISIDPPNEWPGPMGTIRWDRSLCKGPQSPRFVQGQSWQDDLGGMGAGYASVLKGRLYSALGSESDPISRYVALKLREYGVAHCPIRIGESRSDWTLIVTSGRYGDKLPIGFRGCHARLTQELLTPLTESKCDLRVVAALPNHLAAPLLFAPFAKARFFAPSMRNMIDRDCHLLSFANAIDVLSCNRREWEALETHDEVARLVSILIVTDGAAGSTVRFTTPGHMSGHLQVSPFPRDHPPRDSNRAGEAFGSTFIETLLDGGWNAALGTVETSLIRAAAERASAASALVLDLLDFGFPTSAEIDKALLAGRVR